MFASQIGSVQGDNNKQQISPRYVLIGFIVWLSRTLSTAIKLNSSEIFSSEFLQPMLWMCNKSGMLCQQIKSILHLNAPPILINTRIMYLCGLYFFLFVAYHFGFRSNYSPYSQCNIRILNHLYILSSLTLNGIFSLFICWSFSILYRRLQ